MTISVDTGFFFSLKEKNSISLEAWQRIIDKKDKLVISVLVLGELYRLYLKKSLQQEGKEAIESIKEVATVKDVDEEISLLAAVLSCEKKIPLIDSLILSTAKREEAKKFYTSDKKHFGPVISHLRKEIEIIFV